MYSSNCPRPLFFTILATLLLLSPSTAQPISECSEEFESMIPKGGNKPNCHKLTTLKAEFGWTTQKNKSTIDIFFGARLDNDEGWLAWGVNPGTRPQMIGTRAIIGIKNPNGSLTVKTYNITSGTKLGCQLLPTKLDDVLFSNMKIFNRTDFVVMSATVTLPSEYNISELHHVWQVGDEADGDEPKKHPTTLQNVDSTETINLALGVGHSVGQHRRHLRMVHGILNIVGWGTLLPVGVIVARYFREFPFKSGYWFEAHISIQIIGYTLGTIGWAIGLVLGHSSRYYTFRIHRILAIFIFTFTTLQMLALRLRPEKTDEYRKYWDMYHHFLGFALLALISVNIFQGIDILKPEQTWRWVYIGVLGALASITLVLEICTWVKFLRRKRALQNDSKPAPTAQGGGGAPGGAPDGRGGAPGGGGGAPGGGGGAPGGGGGAPGGGGGAPGGRGP